MVSALFMAVPSGSINCFFESDPSRTFSSAKKEQTKVNLVSRHRPTFLRLQKSGYATVEPAIVLFLYLKYYLFIVAMYIY